MYQAGVVNQTVTFNPWGYGAHGFNQFTAPGQNPNSSVFLTSTAFVSPQTMLPPACPAMLM